MPKLLENYEVGDRGSYIHDHLTSGYMGRPESAPKLIKVRTEIPDGMASAILGVLDQECDNKDFVCVAKGEWDSSRNFVYHHDFTWYFYSVRPAHD